MSVSLLAIKKCLYVYTRAHTHICIVLCCVYTVCKNEVVISNSNFWMLPLSTQRLDLILLTQQILLLTSAVLLTNYALRIYTNNAWKSTIDRIFLKNVDSHRNLMVKLYVALHFERTQPLH